MADAKLKSIMHEYADYRLALELYISSLLQKKDWKHLECVRVQLKNKSWDKESLDKFYEWEKKAFSNYRETQKRSLQIAKKIAQQLSDKELSKLEKWINTSSMSLDASEKKIITYDDGEGVIEAKFVQIIYMIKLGKPVDISEVIKKAKTE